MAPTATRHIAEEVVPQFSQQARAAQQRHGGAHLLLQTTQKESSQVVGGGLPRFPVGGRLAGTLEVLLWSRYQNLTWRLPAVTK